MNIKSILEKNVSFQTTAWTPISKEISIQETLNEIREGKYLLQIIKLRSLIKKGELELYDIYKKRLPAVTFCGTFEKSRKKECLKEYNRIIVLDIDKLDLRDLDRIKLELSNDQYVFAHWVSPSQKGIKGLVFVSYEFDFDKKDIDNSHKRAFAKLREYYFGKYNIKLDENGSDTTRLCFLSYDPTLALKLTITPFSIDKTEIVKTKHEDGMVKIIKAINKRDVLYNPNNKNNPLNRKQIKAIINFLAKRSLSITNSYEEWYRVAYAISNSFTFDIGLKYYLELSRLDANKFNEIECRNLLINCYENSKGEISFRTIIHFAKKKGFIINEIKGST